MLYICRVPLKQKHTHIRRGRKRSRIRREAEEKQIALFVCSLGGNKLSFSNLFPLTTTTQTDTHVILYIFLHVFFHNIFRKSTLYPVYLCLCVLRSEILENEKKEEKNRENHLNHSLLYTA